MGLLLTGKPDAKAKPFALLGGSLMARERDPQPFGFDAVAPPLPHFDPQPWPAPGAGSWLPSLKSAAGQKAQDVGLCGLCGGSTSHLGGQKNQNSEPKFNLTQ